MNAVTEATGPNQHLQNLPGWQRRVPVLDFCSSSSAHPRWPLRSRDCKSRRYRARARKLTSEQESTIRALAATRSLLSLAADFVSAMRPSGLWYVEPVSKVVASSG